MKSRILMNNHLSSITHINLANGFRGGERQTFLLMQQLSSRGYEQSLIAKKNSLLAIKANEIDNVRIVESRFNAVDCFEHLRKDTVLHFHESRGFFSAWLLGLANGSKYVITRRVQRPPRSTFINKMLFKNANSIIVLSHAIGESTEAALGVKLNYKIIRSAKTGFIPNQEEVDKIKSTLKEKFVVGHIGALDDSHKGQQQIIELAKRTHLTQPDIHFMLLGSGKDSDHFKQLSRGLENIEFVGQVDNVGDYLALFDVFIFPSRHEGLGSILLDAMDFGLPIIGSNEGGIPEVIEDGLNGFLVDVNNTDGYQDALHKLYSDLNLRAEIKKVNLEKSKEYSPEHMTDKYIKIYNKLHNAS